MPEPVWNGSYQFHRSSGRTSKRLVDRGANRSDDIDVSFFVFTANHIGFARFAAGDLRVQRVAMILDMQPVPNLQPIAVNRQFVTVHGV